MKHGAQRVKKIMDQKAFEKRDFIQKRYLKQKKRKRRRKENFINHIESHTVQHSEIGPHSRGAVDSQWTAPRDLQILSCAVRVNLIHMLNGCLQMQNNSDLSFKGLTCVALYLSVYRAHVGRRLHVRVGGLSCDLLTRCTIHSTIG